LYVSERDILVAKKKLTEADGANQSAPQDTNPSATTVVQSITPAEPAKQDPKDTIDDDAEKDIEKSNSIHVAETKLRVLRTVKVNGSDEDTSGTDETIDVQTFVTVPAMVSVGVPVKISRAYQSIGIEVSVSLPCYKEEIKEARDLAYALAKERVFTEIPIIQKALNALVASANGQQPPVT
jgi:hypothetical protein